MTPEVIWEDAVRRLSAAVCDRNRDLAQAPGHRVLTLTENEPPDAGRLRSLSIHLSKGVKVVKPELRLRLDAEGLVEVSDTGHTGKGDERSPTVPPGCAHDHVHPLRD
jgi:hypothetical protein